MRKRISGIYKIINKIDGNFYIGSSKNIYKRWNKHIYALKNNNHHNNKLQNAWNKYGKDNFEFLIEYNMNDQNLENIIIYEQKLLDEHFGKKYCYNISKKALLLKEDIRTLLSKNMSGYKNPMFGKHHTDESKQKIRERAIKRKHTQESIEKIKNSLIGEKNHFYRKFHTEETKNKIRNHPNIISNGFLGKHHSKITKLNQSKLISEKYLGKNNPRFDKNIYKFFNIKTKEFFEGSRYDFYTKYNLHRGEVGRLINKTKNCKSVKNWMLYI